MRSKINMDRVEYDALYSFVTRREYPIDSSKDDKRRLREKASCFLVVDDELHHKGHAGRVQRIVIGDEEKMRIMRSIHNDVVGGCHFGQNATLEKVADRFWWRSMSTDIRGFVRTCPECQRSNVRNQPPPATLHPIPVHGLFHRWGIDLIGPLNETRQAKRYIIVATEYLTRWAEVDAIEDKSAESVHAFLLRLVFRFGAWEVLLHDQGREFCNKLVADLMAKMEVDIAMTSAYHPQTNGLTER